jgi:hypothetical protein
LNPDNSSYRLCLSIRDTELHRFVAVMCDSNIHALIREGSPPEAELLSTWENIITEYSEALGSTEQKIYISTLKDASRTRWTLDQITRLIEVMKSYYAPALGSQLNALLYTSFTFDPEGDREGYEKMLKRCYSMSKGLKLDLDLKEKQLEDMEGNMKGTTPTRDYFETALITLSDHAGYGLNNRMMTSEFCQRLNRYTKYCEQQKNK